MTAATPPMKSEIGFLNTRHDTEFGRHKRGFADWPQEIGGRLVAQIKQRPRYSLQAAL